MRIVEGLGELERGPRRVLTVGAFDGMHLGHRALIAEARQQAERLDARSTVVTFEPMPLELLRPEAAPGRLSGSGRRAALVGEEGPDELLVLPFDRALAALTPERFVREVLVETAGAVHVVVGEDFRFGHRAAGDAAELARLGEAGGFDVTALPLVRVGDERVSSSWIRELVSQGEVAHAAGLLGRDPWLDGAVVRGDGRGRQLGMPTANLAWPGRRVVPARGIYAGTAALAPGERRYVAAISVSGNPTFGEGRPLSVEAYLLDFDEEIYGCPMRLEFRRFLRHELKFDSIDDLVRRMWQDVDEVRAVMAGDA